MYRQREDFTVCLGLEVDGSDDNLKRAGTASFRR